MNLIVFFDLVTFLTSLVALIILLIGWKRILERDVKLLIAGLLIFTLLYSFCLVLEWSGITSALDPFEDLIGALIPMWWAFLFYAILQQIDGLDLRQSEERFRQLAAGTFEAVVIHDRDEIIEANKQYYDMFGYKPEELAGKDAILLTTTSDSLKVIKEQTSLDDPVPYEVSGLKKDGTEFPMEIRVKSLEFREQKVRMAAIRDLTERKKAEESLANALKELKDFMNAIPDIAYKIRHDLSIANWNSAAEEILGYSSEEIGRMNALEFFPKGDHEKVAKAIQEVYDQGQSELDAHILTKDEKKVPCLLSGRISKDSEGNITGFAGVAKDLTKALQAEEEKKNLEVQLQQSQKMESIGTLAGGIAHDFNNVLYSIIGYTELTMDDVPDGSLPQKNLKEVLKAAMRAKDMVQQILTFSRKTLTKKKPIKIQSVIEEVLKLLRTSIPTTIDIRQNFDTECGLVLADSTQIHQVVMNLATNAYQAMREKGGLLELTLMEEEIGSYDSGLDLDSGRYLKLNVSDTGHGMDRVVKEKIFDPYFTTRGPGEGTGMGLAVVHGIVKSHGGNINVYSKLDEGTTFSVYLPLIETRPIESKILPAETVPTGKERILLVDDEEPIVFMTQQILERLGYQVTYSTSSVEALKAFKAKPDELDLIITDMTMPNMTGIELVPKFLEIRPDIPIIICTGFSEMINKEKSKAIGIREYVMKPIIKEEIARTIKKVLVEGKEK